MDSIAIVQLQLIPHTVRGAAPGQWIQNKTKAKAQPGLRTTFNVIVNTPGEEVNLEFAVLENQTREPQHLF